VSEGRRGELVISTVLRAGVITSMAVILLGTLVSFIHHREYLSSPAELARLTRPGAAVPQTLGGVWSGVLGLRGQSIVAAGLLLLILTPVFRVAASVIVFLTQKDRTYVLITLVVLLLLLLSFVLGSVSG
jgi:uncharacterized membrane protein